MSTKTDLQFIKELLDKKNIEYEVTKKTSPYIVQSPAHSGGLIEEASIELLTEVDKLNHVGYSNFETSFYFSEDEEFLGLGTWE